MFKKLRVLQIDVSWKNDKVMDYEKKFSLDLSMDREDRTMTIPLDQEIILENTEIDASMDLPPETFLFHKDDIYIMPKGSINVLCAKSGVGKTAFSAILMGVLLGCDQFEIKSDIKNASVIYIDTEQSPNQQLKVLRYINELSGKDSKYKNPQIHAFNCVSISPEERADLVENALKKYPSDFVVLDGTRDCILDINRQDDAGKIVSRLMKIAKENNCSILNLIHVNKAEDSKDPRGALGTELVNKSTDGFIMDKDGDTFVVKHEIKHRNLQWLSDFRFVRAKDRGGLPQPFTGKLSSEIKAENDLHLCVSAIVKTFKDNGNTQLNTGELIDCITALTNIGKRKIEGMWEGILNYMGENLTMEQKGRPKLFNLTNPDNYVDNVKVSPK